MGRKQSKGYRFEQLSYDVIGACVEVQRQLGLHCKEVDYQRALAIAFSRKGLHFQREVEVPVVFDGVVVTQRRVDFVVWNDTEKLILEVKAKGFISPEDVHQCLLYLQRGGYSVCLLINFGEKPLGIRRLVYTPDRDNP